MTLPQTPSFRLDGKRALITGASRGIGLGCATALAEAGAHVTLVARGADALNEVATAFTTRGWPATAHALDITDTEAVRALVTEIGPFDILCNAAGTARHAPAQDTTEADYDAVMETNTRAAYFLARAVAGTMPPGGSIIQISSQMGHVGGPDRAVYAASKHALEGMTKAMAIDWGPKNIRVNTICPTFVRTTLNAATFDDPVKRAWIEDKIKLPRVAEVTDIMGAVVFLASDAAAMITGTALMVDGGWTAG